MKLSLSGCLSRCGILAFALLTFWFGATDESVADSALTDALVPYAQGRFSVALELLKPLAAAGSPVALLTLGRMYLCGEGVVRNTAEAFSLIRDASQNGEPNAQYELALMFRDGVGTAADGRQALRWFGFAADSGLAEAMNAIGEMYTDHPDIPQDLGGALTWYLRAADLNSPQAAYDIGVSYALGRGAPIDEIEAYKWFDIAAGLEPDRVQNRAVYARRALSENMTPLQVWEAKTRAEEWKLGRCCEMISTDLSGSPRRTRDAIAR